MSNIEQVKQSHYDETQIQVLEGLEAVRKRPGMYIGSTGPRGLHHLVYEIVDNAIDEALAGYCTHIETEILEGDVIRVTDNGRGIPVGIHPKMGIPAVTVVYTILHAGGKFGGEGYKVSGGLHGVGASVVNALSEWLIVEVKNGEHIYQQKFARGVAQGDLTIIGDTDETGTRVTFKPDGEIFEELVYDYETLHTRLREQAFLNAGVRMTITDRRTPTGPSDSMCYEGGIRSFVEFIHQRRGLEALHEDVIYMKGDSGDNVAEVAMQYNDSYNELLLSFANNINTGEGGTHEDGFKQALTRVLNAYARKNNLLKDSDKNLSGEDCREGLTAIISVKLREPQFEGQTKGKLGNTEMRQVVSAIVTDKLTTYFEENPQVARTIIEKAITASRAAEAARKAEERLKYMTFYSTTQHCLRGFLLQYFGEAAPQKCGNCSCCLAAEQEAQLQVEYARRRAAQSADRLEKPRRAKPAAAGSLSEADEKLLNALYAVRKRLAGKQNLPAFMVFNDATLREMAEKKPMSIDELLNISGVGEKKAARYGNAFLRVIEDAVGSRE